MLKIKNISNKFRQWDNHLINIKFMIAILIVFYLNGNIVDFFEFNGLNLIVRGLTVLWFGLILYENPKFFMKLVCIFIPIIFCGIILLWAAYVEKCAMAKGDIRQIIYLVSIAAVFLYYIDERKRYNNKRVIILLFVWLIDVILCSVYSIYRLRENPLLSRWMAAGLDIPNPEGIISYSVVYGLVILAPICFYRLLHCKKRYMLYWLLLVVLFMITLLLAQFTIAIVFVCIGIVFVAVWEMLSKKKGLYYIIGIISCIFMLLLSLDKIVSLNIFPEEINVRLQEIYNLLNGNSGDSSDLMARLRLYTQSIKAISANYFLGAAFIGNGAVGGHSELLDMIGQYGIIYFGFFFWFLVNYYQYVRKNIKNGDIGIYNISLGIFTALSLINTTLWAATLLVFLGILPSILCVLGEHNLTFVEEMNTRRREYDNSFY